MSITRLIVSPRASEEVEWRERGAGETIIDDDKEILLSRREGAWPIETAHES
jgi:hypothetical protein